MSRTREVGWLAAILASFLALAVFLACYLVPWDDEFGYIIYGPLAWTGQLRLFQDEMTGQRLPLPYWVIGLSQVITGTSVLTARLTSIVLGATTIGLTFALGRVLGGSAAGFMSALFLATHALVVGYYAGASYHALSSLLLVAGLLAISRERSPGWPVLGMALIGGLWLCRANLAAMVPVVLVYLLVRARSRGEQLALLFAGLLPLAVFLAWSQEHLKILAYVPLASRLVEPLGYRSLFALQDFPEGKPFAESLWWLVRRHLPWVIATVLLAAAIATRLRRPRVRWPSPPPPPLVVFVAVLAVYALGCQMVILNMYLKSVAAWMNAFAPLWAVVLGYTASRLLEPGMVLPPVRAGLAVALAALFAVSPVVSRHTAMPLTLPAQSMLGVLEDQADRIRAVVPPGERIFFFGTTPIPAHLAGARFYIQQVLHTRTFVPRGDDRVVSRSGLWGPRQVDEWLSQEARYAIVEPRLLDVYRTTEPDYRPVIDQIEAALARHFVPVSEGGDGLWTPAFRVYRRTTPRPAAGLEPGVSGVLRFPG
jgi:4-amino-4-deoxy-L-arabinose transferase-like glycosyltransferase